MTVTTMTGGTPHGNWPVQYECRFCGTIVVPPPAASDPNPETHRAR